METQKEKFLGVREMSPYEMKHVGGGGWIADFIERLICGCYNIPNILPDARTQNFYHPGKM
jgi:hypothetical protein